MKVTWEPVRRAEKTFGLAFLFICNKPMKVLEIGLILLFWGGILKFDWSQS